MTPNTIISRAAAMAGDPHFLIVNREEHIQYLNEAANDLWSRSKAMHALRQYVLPATANHFDIPDTDIISFLLVQLLQKSQASPEEEILLTFDSEHIPSTLEERPVLSAMEEGYGVFADMGNQYPSEHFSIVHMNNLYRFTTPTAFGENKVLQVFAVVTGPIFTWLVGEEALNDTARHIWTPVSNYFLEACTWRAASEVHRVTGLPSAQRIWAASYTRAEQKLSDAVHMINSLKDEGSVHHIRPHFFLGGEYTQ